VLLLHAGYALRFGFIEEEQKLDGRPFFVVHFSSPVPVVRVVASSDLARVFRSKSLDACASLKHSFLRNHATEHARRKRANHFVLHFDSVAAQ
jgi:hypothetical protein